MGEGREGDWECKCKNRDYAFRYFCNRCKQPRLLVDTKTPADSKWLPRVGDWICTDCTNNNYASREQCKKCGQPKDIAAMPAIAMHRASIPTFSHYFARAPEELERNMKIGLQSNGAIQQFLLNSSWSLGGSVNFGPFSGNHGSGLGNLSNQASSVMKEWRNGDWMCICSFRNYSSRAQMPFLFPLYHSLEVRRDMKYGFVKHIANRYATLGTKRLASEEFVHDWENKRFNLGYTNGQQKPCPGVEQVVGSAVEMKIGVYSPYAGVPSWQVPVPFPYQATVTTLVGKGGKQWRNGDWMCPNCQNHNYAYRSECSRWKTEKETVA